ncbi:hypothetical protein [Mycolicibacterium fortuitum]|uniref:hypothetical protein n=1 Tax=Mycolicibacterium fortuitum TaxID=1766 RepID=UPI0007EB6A5B|nr:hypothetical protein [Mycolicibacterium fortuitum]MCA4755256.1 hypothetical protein [Mycolicibacterium fortuitum]OBF79427.1 hypothetical protein A5751_19100 [Mycolicibacterium fortuitum]UBV22999.1 hypothetical protein H8Z59_07595 [Mycolicibacterium fortuitum]
MVVLIGSQPSLWAWLGPVLLFVASLVATGATLFGVLKSNKTNRNAIAAADSRANTDRAEARDRDFRQWQRDTLVRLSSEVIESALDANASYNRLAHSTKPLDENSADSIEAAGRRVAVGGLNLRLIGAHRAADQCVNLRNAIQNGDALGAMVDYNVVFRRSLRPGADEDQEELGKLVAGSRAAFDTYRQSIDDARGRFGEIVEQELHTLSATPKKTDNIGC